MKRLTAFLLIGMLMLACQPTPAQEIVINAGDAIGDERIAATAKPDVPDAFEEPAKTLQSEGVPAHWTDDASTENLTVLD